MVIEHALNTERSNQNPLTPPGNHVTCLENIIERQETQIEWLSAITNDIKDTTDQSKNAIDKAVEHARTTLEEITILPTTTATRDSYADALKNGTPAQHAEVLAQSEAQSRQVIIKNDSNNLHDLTEKELVTKANLPIENMDLIADNLPINFTFLSVRKLRGSKVSYEINTQENAKWLQKTENQQLFLQYYNGSATIVQKTYKTVVEFVPITFAEQDGSALWDVETMSGLQQDDLCSIKWIKPKEYQSPKERVAHTIASFASREAANQAMRNGLNIEGRKVCAHKQLPEANRCYGCQSLDQSHFARECKHGHSVCGTCGEHHSTRECVVSDPAKFYCVNCNEKGHAAWSRNCNAFTKARRKLWATNKEARYRYFPIPSDSPTWETIDGEFINPIPGPGLTPEPEPMAPTHGRSKRTTNVTRSACSTLKSTQGSNPPIGTQDAGWKNRHQVRIDDYINGNSQPTNTPGPSRHPRDGRSIPRPTSLGRTNDYSDNEGSEDTIQ